MDAVQTLSAKRGESITRRGCTHHHLYQRDRYFNSCLMWVKKKTRMNSLSVDSEEGRKRGFHRLLSRLSQQNIPIFDSFIHVLRSLGLTRNEGEKDHHPMLFSRDEDDDHHFMLFCMFWSNPVFLDCLHSPSSSYYSDAQMFESC